MKLRVTMIIDTEEPTLYEAIHRLTRDECLEKYFKDQGIDEADQAELEPSELVLVHWAFADQWQRSVTVELVPDPVN